MALNNSGKISLAGSTAGESVALELSKSATGMISMNDTDVRTLAGMTTGMIQLDDFYGKSSGLGYFISSAFLPSGYTFQSLIYADDSFFMSIQTNSVTGNPYSGSLVVKINSDFTSYTITPNQIESIYGRYNSGLTTVNREYSLQYPIYDGNRLIYATQVQKQSAGTANRCGDVGLVEWDTTTNSYVRSIQFGHYYSSGTVTGPSPRFLHKSWDGNYYCLSISGSTNLNPRGYQNLNKSDFTHNSPVLSTSSDMHNASMPAFYNQPTLKGCWYHIVSNSSTSSTTNRFKIYNVNSSYSQIGVISEIAATYLSHTAGIDGSCFVTSRINGTVRKTIYLQKYDISGNLLWTKSCGTGGVDIASAGANFMHSQDGFIYLNVTVGVSVSTVLKMDYDGNVILGRGLAFSSFGSTIVGLYLTIPSTKFNQDSLLLNDTSDGPIIWGGGSVTTPATGLKYFFGKLSSNLLNVGTYTVNGETITVTDQTSAVTFSSSGPIAAGAAISSIPSYITELQSNSHTFSAKTPSGITLGKTNV